MITQAAKKYRELLAFALLGVAALYFISAVSLLFKSEDDFAGAGFAERSAVVGYLFTHPILVVSLAAALALAVGFGEPSKIAKPVVLAALALGGLSLLFGLIAWFSSFGADSGAGFEEVFNGVIGAGKVVGIFLGLAQLLFLALVLFFAFTLLKAFPRASTSGQWAQPGGYGQQGGYPQGGYGPPAGAGAHGWSQQPLPHGDPQHGYPPQQSWGQQGGWGQAGDVQQAQQWGQEYPGGATAAGWGDQPAVDAQQQGQPAATWDQSSQGWSHQGGPPQGQPVHGYGPADEHTQWSQPDESEQAERPADPPPPPGSGWQQQRPQ